MKRIIAAMMFCMSATSYSASSGSAGTHVMQLRSSQQKTEIATQFETQPISFGLTAKQRARIYEITAGDVDFRNFYFVKVPSGQDQLIAGVNGHLGKHPEVALPPHHGAPLGMTAASKENMDPDLLGQWWASKYRMTNVWDYATGKGVTIADCDTGFYVNEPDLKFNLLQEHSRDFADPNNSRRINDGRFVFHGTAVAALMSGVRDSRGTNGIAFNAKLVPLQYYNFDPALDQIDKEEATARCILHAIKIPRVRIIVVQNQTTMGSAETFAGTREAVKLALRAGINVVTTAGNSSLELKTEAQNDTGSIIVGAVHENSDKAVFSNYGRRVTIGAYGEKLYTLYGPSGRMDSFGGTTAAAAQVAATVALILEVNPDLTPKQIKDILVLTAQRTAANKEVGGLLHILDAVQMASDSFGEIANLNEQRRFRAKLIPVLSSGSHLRQAVGK